MARKKIAPDLSPEAVAANKAGDARREKEKQARQRNAEKQKRFREGMKEAGYRRVTLWDVPCAAHKRMADQGFRQVPAWEDTRKPKEKSRAVKVKFAVQINEKSLHIGARVPAVQKALSYAAGTFLKELGNLPDKNTVYADYLELLSLLGGEG